MGNWLYYQAGPSKWQVYVYEARPVRIRVDEIKRGDSYREGDLEKWRWQFELRDVIGDGKYNVITSGYSSSSDRAKITAIKFAQNYVNNMSNAIKACLLPDK